MNEQLIAEPTIMVKKTDLLRIVAYLTIALPPTSYDLSKKQHLLDIIGEYLSKTEDHKERHDNLHKSLDELVADFVWQTQILPSQTTIMELITWSYEQTKNPTVKEGG